LTDAERGGDRYLTEFQYEASGSTAGVNSLISSSVPEMTTGFSRFFANTGSTVRIPRYKPYVLRERSAQFDARAITAMPSGAPMRSSFRGGRVRGTIYQHLGYYLQATNAQFYGSRDLLQRDR